MDVGVRRDLRESLEELMHLRSAESAVESDAERVGVLHRHVEGFCVLTGEGATGGVNDCS